MKSYKHQPSWGGFPSRKEIDMAKRDFNEFRFSGLNYRDKSNKYFTMDRVSEDETKIVVKVADSHLLKTKYGFALILNAEHVVFLKDWQVSDNYYGIEVLLTKEYFTPKKWGEFPDFDYEEENLTWEEWLETAKAQSATETDEDGYTTKINPVHWEK